MASVTSINFDTLLQKWAEHRLGSQGTNIVIDTSDINITQCAVVYEGGNDDLDDDWYKTSVLHERIYENDGDFRETWQYCNSYRLKSDITWSVTRVLRSDKLIPFKLELEYPAYAASAEVTEPPTCTFSNTDIANTHNDKYHTGRDEWLLSKEISVNPYSSVHVCVVLKTCTLRSAVFHTELRFSGKLRATGVPSKLSKKKGACVEMVEDIVDAMDSIGEVDRLRSDKPSLCSFSVLESMCLESSRRQLCFRFEGLCSGSIATDVDLLLKDMESTL